MIIAKMDSTPKSLRLQIGIFGRRNVGKSSLLNAITNQSVSIVSEFAGTTTDPVEKPMELLPLGAVLFIDTAGIDDVGALGELRIEKTKKVFDRSDVGIIVTTGDDWGGFEQTISKELKERKIPIIAVFNKCDIRCPSNETTDSIKKQGITVVEAISIQNKGILDLRQALIQNAPEDFINNPSIVSDLLGEGKIAILVVPIDKEAPKGRLIAPQVQTIRDILDGDSYCMVVKERELADALKKLNTPPAIVITDSQAFLKVAADTPEDVPMTSFSILFARFKGDLDEFIKGVKTIDTLKSGDRVLIAESCSHHPISEDIGRVKIPRWIRQYTGAKIEFDTYAGNDFPANLSDYSLVIQCGGCMTNRRQVLSRIMHCRKAGVPITNYGVAIAFSLGIFERAIKPFQKQ